MKSKNKVARLIFASVMGDELRRRTESGEDPVDINALVRPAEAFVSQVESGEIRIESVTTSDGVISIPEDMGAESVFEILEPLLEIESASKGPTFDIIYDLGVS